jgi:hypothetical protein
MAVWGRRGALAAREGRQAQQEGRAAQGAVLGEVDAAQTDEDPVSRRGLLVDVHGYYYREGA